MQIVHFRIVQFHSRNEFMYDFVFSKFAGKEFVYDFVLLKLAGNLICVLFRSIKIRGKIGFVYEFVFLDNRGEVYLLC